jgi:signal transduction histidine kinase
MKKFHRRIALWFVTLSSVVYLSLSFLGLFVFYGTTNSALDEELKVMLSEFGHAVDFDGTTPKFREWIRSVQTEPQKGLATIELFDPDKKLLEHHGPHGLKQFIRSGTELLSEKGIKMRAVSTPLRFKGKLVGYMQVELPTTERDKSVWNLLATMVMICPAILLGLGVSSYVVAGKAAAPLQESVEKMKLFIADAGHELNTPLSILRARLETLERRHERLNIDTTDLGLALKSMSRMEKVIEDLMLLTELDAEIESDAPTTTQQEVLLSALVTDLAHEFEARFEEKGVALEHQILSDGKVRGEPTALHRGLANLVENALRYTDAGGRVKLELACSDGLAHISVIDSGIGISDLDLKKIFDRFFRSDKSRSRASGGVGLGLAIAQSIALTHGGKINVTSQLGKGSNFQLILPLSPVHSNKIHIQENANVSRSV